MAALPYKAVLLYTYLNLVMEGVALTLSFKDKVLLIVMATVVYEVAKLRAFLCCTLYSYWQVYIGDYVLLQTPAQIMGQDAKIGK